MTGHIVSVPRLAAFASPQKLLSWLREPSSGFEMSVTTYNGGVAQNSTLFQRYYGYTCPWKKAWNAGTAKASQRCQSMCMHRGLLHDVWGEKALTNKCFSDGRLYQKNLHTFNVGVPDLWRKRNVAKILALTRVEDTCHHQVRSGEDFQPDADHVCQSLKNETVLSRIRGFFQWPCQVFCLASWLHL